MRHLARVSGAVVGLCTVVSLVWTPMAVSADPVKTVKVDCAKGETIAAALAQGDERKPLVVVVAGVCNENVDVARDDVTLQGDPAVGGAVNGPDATANAISVTGRRVTIDGLLVTGGFNGIRVLGASPVTIQNSRVQNTGHTGIVYFQGASGTVDGCTVQNNPRDGIAIESASAIVINSLVAQNGRGGVLITDGGSGRIGIDRLNVPAGNTITQNSSSGISISLASGAFIGANTITFNGSDPAGELGRFGVIVTNAMAQIVGLNSITDNAGAGLLTTSAIVRIGNPTFGFSTANTISRNGALSSANGGISASLGSSLQVQNATITQNTGPGIFGFLDTSLQLQGSTLSGNTSASNGFGVILSLRSTGQLFGNTIQNNSLDGIRLVFGSGLFLQAPVTIDSGNGGFGLQCTDGESSVVNTVFLSLSGNGAGGVSGSCTGF